MPRKRVGKTGLKSNSVEFWGFSAKPCGRPPQVKNRNNQYQKWPSAIESMYSLLIDKDHELYPEAGRQRGSNELVLISNSGWRKWPAQVWRYKCLGSWEAGGGVLGCTNYRTTFLSYFLGIREILCHLKFIFRQLNTLPYVMRLPSHLDLLFTKFSLNNEHGDDWKLESVHSFR